MKKRILISSIIFFFWQLVFCDDYLNTGVFVYKNFIYKVDEKKQVQLINSENIKKIKKDSIMVISSGLILLWDCESRNLLLITDTGNIQKTIPFDFDNVILSNNRVLTQSLLSNNRGYEYGFFSIDKHFLITRIWKGNIDCKLSDFYLSDDKAWIAGSNIEDTVNRVYLINSKGAQKKFNIVKDNNFLRIIPVSSDKNCVCCFLSEHSKKRTQPIVYLVDSDTTFNRSVDLTNLEDFPKDFLCFYGYGFSFDNCYVFPIVQKKHISFLRVNNALSNIQTISSDTKGCYKLLYKNSDSVVYFTFDPEDANKKKWLGLYNGTSSMMKSLQLADN